ncbi:MAG: cytochrome P450 [Pseudomonadota bacterium]
MSKPTPEQATQRGLNGVAIPQRQTRPDDAAPGYRTYEVYQRERVGESTEKIKPMQLVSADYAADPFPLMSILRDNYPCYRDWVNNCYWVSGYNDVTSIFSDDANFTSRSKLWYYQQEAYGRDLSDQLAVQVCRAEGMDQFATPVAEQLVEQLQAQIQATGSADLARTFAAQYNPLLQARILDLPDALVEPFANLHWQMQRGAKWQPQRTEAGWAATLAMEELLAPLLQTRQAGGGTDLISVVAELGGSAADLVTTVLEHDHATLHGGLANLWHHLLTDDTAPTAQILDEVRQDRRLLKVAYLETLRHAPPVVTAHRFARHEVERFGRLLPEGALLKVSAAGANRDPRVFADPDVYQRQRRDICHREPRGQYRADGLASGIAFGLGKPSIHPAVPEDRPRSLYALTRDTVIKASQVLLESLPNLQLTDTPRQHCLGLDELYACWSLQIKA